MERHLSSFMRLYSLKLTAIFVLGFSLLSVAQESPGHFKLEGEITGLKDGAKVYLIRKKTAGSILLDTIGVSTSKAEKFSFKEQIPQQIGFYYLQYEGLKLKSQTLILINAGMSLKGDLLSWPKLELTGSGPHQEYLEIIKLNDEMNAGLKAEKADKTTADSRKIALFKPYIVAHSNSLLVPYLIEQLESVTELAELKQLYNRLGKDAKNGYFGVALAEKLKTMERLAAIKLGSVIPDFNLTMADGKIVSIKSLAEKNKITLIDFWASWCAPCRMEIPNLKEVYSNYHEKGFGILGISSEGKAETWRKALAEDNTPWLQGLDTNLATNNIFKLNAIPSYMMIDQEGKIIALELFSPIKGGGPALRGKALHETVKKLLEEKGK